VDVKTDERLVRLDRHLSEYFLFQSLWTLFKSRFHGRSWRDRGGIETAAILDAWKNLPRRVLPRERNKRQFLSGVLARNEVNRDYAYNRRLFLRIGHGWYQFNPALALRRRDASGETWIPIFEALNLRFVLETASPRQWPRIEVLLGAAGLPQPSAPIGGERIMQQMREECAEYEAMLRAQEADNAEPEVTALPSPAPSSPPTAADPAPWGTPAARRAEIERIRRQIEENTARREGRANGAS
jgi:hypothetical protein